VTTFATVSAAVADVRAKFEACAADITALADVEGHSIYVQAGLPYWTLRLERMDVASTSANIVQYNVSAIAIYHGWPFTGGQDGEFEKESQLYLVWLPAEFDARPQFNSDAYPTGSGYLAPEGVIVTGARTVRISVGESISHLAVIVEMTIPLELQIEEAY
jgi:hypothetical protein